MLDETQNIPPVNPRVKLSAIEKFFVFFTGYKAVDAERNTVHPEELRELVLSGGSVLLATLVAVGNWYVFGAYHLSDHNQLIAMTSSALGAATVLFFDKAFLHSMDTLHHSTHWGKKCSLLVLRFAASLAISYLTSQTVLALLLEKEQAATAFTMKKEERDNELSKDPYHVNTQQTSVQAQNQTVVQLQQAMATLPESIRIEFNQATQCRSTYNALKKQHGLYDESIVAKRRQCQSLEHTANVHKTAYQNKVQQDLLSARHQLGDMTTQLNQAQSSQQADLQAIGKNAEQNYTASSSLVMEQLMKTSPEAKHKRWLISGVITLLELLPYLLKLFGQSLIGQRIASKKLLQMKSLHNEETKILHYFETENALRKMTNEATTEALNNPMVKQVFFDAFMTSMQVFAPFEAVQAMMRELEKNAYSVNTFQQRFPDYAEVIGMAWHRAIQQACDILSTPASSASTV
jgi:hypothetical protein